MHMDDDNAVTTEEKVWDLTFNVNVKGVFFGWARADAVFLSVALSLGTRLLPSPSHPFLFCFITILLLFASFF